MTESYTVKDIQVLNGLEAVRKRPGMYIGGTSREGMHQLVWEILDNAVDEALNGYCDRIEVVLAADGSVSVEDWGRGIPLAKHPVTGKNTVETIFCHLHAGGKFDERAYKVAGGLHGVGASVVNALSERLVVEVRRGGSRYVQEFSRGEPRNRLRRVGQAEGTGTKVTFWPDPEIFGDRTFSKSVIRERVEIKSFLIAGLTIRLRDETDGTEPLGAGNRVDLSPSGSSAMAGSVGSTHMDPPDFGQGRTASDPAAGSADETESEDNSSPVEDGSTRGGKEETFYYPGGILDYLAKLVAGQESVEAQPFHFPHSNDLRLEVAMTWTLDTASRVLSFVNSIPTPAGGTHETGFRNGVTRALRTYVEKRNGLPKGIKGISAEDVREGLVAVISLYIQGNLEFQGQTKEKLNSPVAQQVEPLVRTAFENWLHQNPTQAAAIVNRVVLAAQARSASRAARDEVTRKAATRRLTLPGKLADCSSASRDDTELFIVEGDSAGGSSKQARDRRFQAVLPIRGKILNVEQASDEKLKANKEIQSLVQSIGTGMGRSFDYSKLRYGRIVINTDADVDGHHIATLLLTFFYRYMPELIAKGHVYLADPPLYRIRIGAGKKHEIRYVYSDREKEQLLKKRNGKDVEVQRFKGLGEMDAGTLKSTTMDPTTRSMLKVSVHDLDRTSQTFDTLMGKDVRKRFTFIKENALEVRDLDI
ncbi:MAG: DNA topoisomerase IV subunit B [Thermodesulfobacteriota bacterium]